MTAISTAYTNVLSRVAMLLPNHTRLPQPYALEDNNDQFLRQGYSVTVTPAGNNSQRFVSKLSSIVVPFTIAITRQYYAREFDAGSKSDTEKLLLDDFQTLLDDSHDNNFNLNGPVTIMTGFDGIFPVRTDDFKFLALIANLDVEVFN